MTTNFLPGTHPSEPVPTGTQGFGDWLTVAEAVAYCTDKGLARTPKTVRKWAHRSHLHPDNAELVVRREDVDNGFRWTVERASLDLKIEQELEFEARRAKDEGGAPVHTGADASEQVHTSAMSEQSEIEDSNPSAPVHTGAHASEQVRSDEGTVKQLVARIDDLKAEVEFYRDELRDRRQTTTALTDVIEAFRLTAQTNAHNALSKSERDHRRSDVGYRNAEGDNTSNGEHRGTV
jgi:hypothetical protein